MDVKASFFTSWQNGFHQHNLKKKTTNQPFPTFNICTKWRFNGWLVVFYSISTFGYLMPNPVYTYI